MDGSYAKEITTYMGEGFSLCPSEHQLCDFGKEAERHIDKPQMVILLIVDAPDPVPKTVYPPRRLSKSRTNAVISGRVIKKTRVKTGKANKSAYVKVKSDVRSILEHGRIKSNTDKLCWGEEVIDVEENGKVEESDKVEVKGKEVETQGKEVEVKDTLWPLGTLWED